MIGVAVTTDNLSVGKFVEGDDGLKVLFICMNYFPYTGACSSLLVNMFSTGTLQKDIDIHVLAIKQGLSDPDMEEINGITIHRIIRWDVLSMQSIKKDFMRKPCVACQGLLIKAKTKIDKSLHYRAFVDRQLLNSLKRKLHALLSESYDVVIPVAGSYEAVQAALDSFQEERIIIYQVDPCSTNTAFSKESYAERCYLEKRMCTDADAVITTPILRDQWLLDHPDAASEKIISMEFPNVNPSQYSTKQVMESGTRRGYSCVFVGGIYRAARNPAYTFKLFGALKETGINLSIVGAEKENMREFIAEEEIASNISFYGRLPLQEAQRHMEQADILVNIGNIMTNQVPSKLFEYVSYGKPIINICKNRNCPTLPYLEKYPYALNLFEEDDLFDEQVEKLRAFIAMNGNERIPSQEVLGIFETCTPEYCAGQMLKVIKECLKSN